MPITLILDCGACANGPKRGPNLARFVRTAPGTKPPAFELGPDDLAAVLAAIGTDHPKPFTEHGRIAFPYPHLRPDGGVTWQTRCPNGCNRPIRHESVVAALDNFPPGRVFWRVGLG